VTVFFSHSSGVAQPRAGRRRGGQDPRHAPPPYPLTSQSSVDRRPPRPRASNSSFAPPRSVPKCRNAWFIE
jgi:hypothetical protein